ncbi:MAG: SRPBCC family protein [Chlorobi bacterium]|nr:SRPBCC family protein [Chlorobiota bacterium]
MKLNSQPVLLNADQKTVYEFLSDFNNFEQLMPEQIVNWKSDKENCSFTVKGMADLSLKYSHKEPFHTIEVVPAGKSPIDFTLTITIESREQDDRKTTGIIEIDTNLNPMMAMIAKRPLENLVNAMSERLNEIFAG